MLRRTVLYPFLFVFYVVLNPLVYNLDQVEPSQALRPLIVLSLATAFGILLLYVISKDWHYAGYVVFLFLLFLFVSGHLNRLIQSWIVIDQARLNRLLLPLWSALLVVFSLRGFWKRINAQRWMTPLLNVALSAALLSQVIFSFDELYAGWLHMTGDSAVTSSNSSAQSIPIDCTNTPDIYYLVLDAYGRSDVLEELYGVDNTLFLEFLRARGFTVADSSYSNYIQTIYTISSVLNFSYIEPEPPGVSGYRYFRNLMTQNRVMRSLERCGYRTVAFESGFFFTNSFDAEVYLAAGNELNEFEGLLLTDTPVEVLMEWFETEPLENTYRAHRERVRFTFRELAKLPRMRGPKIVFAHIVSPHPPFVFAANGEPVDPPWSYSMGDGINFDGDWEDYQQGYTDQVRFVNRELEKTIDAILKKSSSPPIIILQGDHGPGGFLDWSSPSRTCLWERSSILNAIYLPGGGQEVLYPAISPVNTFRLILNAYFNASLELLPDETYFTSHSLPRQVIDITSRRDSHANCPP